MFELDAKTINNLTISARKIADNYGRKELTDDFTQFMFLKYMEGRNSTVQQLFIDFLRSEYGRSDERGSKGKFKLKNPEPLEHAEKEFTLDKHNIDFNNIVNKLDRDEKIITILYYK